eukprot:scaffold865_cov312-Prasinococcus_capsulatus_cf.AAC.7
MLLRRFWGCGRRGAPQEGRAARAALATCSPRSRSRRARVARRGGGGGATTTTTTSTVAAAAAGCGVCSLRCVAAARARASERRLARRVGRSAERRHAAPQPGRQVHQALRRGAAAAPAPLDAAAAAARAAADADGRGLAWRCAVPAGGGASDPQDLHGGAGERGGHRHDARAGPRRAAPLPHALHRHRDARRRQGCGQRGERPPTRTAAATQGAKEEQRAPLRRPCDRLR